MESAVPGVTPASRPRRRLSAAVTQHRDYSFDLAIAVVVSLLVRLPWVVLVRHGLVNDSSFYYFAAKSIAAGHGYSIVGHPTAFFPVGYPAFLALFFAITGPSVWTILVLNLILWPLIAALVYVLGRRMGGRATGVVAALLVAASPVLSLYVLRAYSEAVFIPLLLTVCLLLTARRESPTLRVAALAGVCLGCAILVRSTAAPLPFLLAIWLLLRTSWREAWRAAAVFCTVACLVVVPWIVRNAIVMHTAVISTNGGVTLWIGDHHPLPPGARHYRIFVWTLKSAHSEVQQNSQLTHDSVSFMVHDTGAWLDRVPDKFRKLMSWNSSPITNALLFQHGPVPHGRNHVTTREARHLHGSEGVLVRGALDNTWIFRIWHYTYWVLGALAMLLALWRRKPAAGLIVLLVAFWMIFHSFLFFGDVRFMISVTPLVAVPLAWLLVRSASLVRRRS